MPRGVRKQPVDQVPEVVEAQFAPISSEGLPDQHQTLRGDGEGDSNLPAVVAQSTIAAMTGAEVDIQVATAHRYGRNVTACLNEAISLATLNPEIAEGCYYSLPRGDKTIQGPSVRLAEIVAGSWQHLRVQTQVIDIDDKFVTARSVAWDLLKNVAFATEARRRITDKWGKRYNDDMIGVTAQAATSIAMRNAVFLVVPQAIVNEVYKRVLKCAAGSAIPLSVRRENALGWFARQGIGRERVFDLLSVGGVNDLTVEHVETLAGLVTALKEGTTTLEEVFPPQPKPEEPEKQEKPDDSGGSLPQGLL